MEEIARVARAEGIAIIEDAAHAIGGTYQDRPVGCCQWSEAAVLSFHAVKIMTTGEGGMVLTNRADLHEKLVRLRTHGITRDKNLLEDSNPAPWHYEQQELGYHYRMTDIQAALGTSQLRRLDDMVHRRREIARKYDEALAELPLTLPWQHPDTNSSWHLYVIRLKPDQLSKSRLQIFQELRAGGIGVNLHYIPVYHHPFYQKLSFQRSDFPESERHFAETISLPMFSKLTNDEQEEVILVLKKALLS
jgi:dTDP-4-amino-4,6-dideoxygalactose transaminase